MKSMTGYAKTQCEVADCVYDIEIKTLNSKQLDLIVKVPAMLRSHELDIRTMLGQLERGKIECTISEISTQSSVAINEDMLTSRYKTLFKVANELGANTEHLFDSLALMGDIWNVGAGKEIDEPSWNVVRQSVQQAIDLCDTFRSQEGSVLENDFNRHVDLIEQLLGEIPHYEEERIQTAKDRIRKWMSEAKIAEVDENRFEQELIYYLEKLDITEEKVRLQKHIDYFRQTMRDEVICGKKLGFVAQEMGREINTTGSKANHVEIQRIVVRMKDELEKIKEQLGNVL